MTEYKVGYCKPPMHTRFKPGVCPNLKGRGKRGAYATADAVRDILDEKVSFAEDGKRKKASRAELSVRRLIRSALSGNVRSAAQLLKMRKHSASTEIGPLTIELLGGLPDRKV